eukprot:8537_1
MAGLSNMEHCLKKLVQRCYTLAVCVVVVLHSLPVGVLGAAAAADEVQNLSVALAKLRNALEPLHEGKWLDAASKTYFVSTRDLEKLNQATKVAMTEAQTAWGALQTQFKDLKAAQTKAQ